MICLSKERYFKVLNRKVKSTVYSEDNILYQEESLFFSTDLNVGPVASMVLSQRAGCCDGKRM